MFPFSYADQLMCGDEVLVHKNDQMSPAEVINVSNFTMQGKYQCDRDNDSLSFCDLCHFKIIIKVWNGIICSKTNYYALLNDTVLFMLMPNF